MAAQLHFDRFVTAQDAIYGDVCAELAAGEKTSHWMWFIFPQLEGLGRSTMAIQYGIASQGEAGAYWQHPTLGARLKECVELVLAVKGKNAFLIFGTPDDLKFRSSMTLFSYAVPDEPLFKRALTKYFQGRDDPRTVELLARS